MKSNKKSIFILIALCVVILVFSVIFFIKRTQKVDENTVTRYEWLQMLGEQFGINEYTDKSPYFRDVDSDNPYFAYVQSAVEGKVVDTASKFNGEDYATGQFIALTAMKSIGESKFRLCLDTADVITDDTYIEFAIEHGLIEEEKLKKGFSQEECEQVLENLKSIYFGELWKDDYSNVTYQDSVKELSPKEVLWSNADCSEIAVTDSILSSLEVGDIIVFEQENTKIKFGREITGIDSDGTLYLSTVELDKVVESLIESDIQELTFDDIVNYYGLNENINALNNLKYQQTDAGFTNTRVFSNENSKGFKISISTEGESKERHIEIKVTDKSTGISYAIPISNQVKSEDNEYSAEIDIDRIYIGGQIDYSVLGGLKYAEAAVDVHATFKSEIKAEEEKKIRLLKTAIPLGNGIAQADIELYIVLSVDGSISFEAELPIEVSVSYEKNRGLRNFESNFSAEETRINVNCNASAVFRIEPTLVILGCFNVMDMEADIGVTASAEVVTHSNSQICADISASFPVCTLSICGDDDVDTIIGDLGLSAEWEIISSENAPIQLGLHYECLPDKSTQFVEKCTYEEKEEASSMNIKQENSISEEATEFAKYSTYEPPIELWVNTPFEDLGDYYTVKGNLQLSYAILVKDFDKLNIGDHFTILDKEFILEEKLMIEEFPERIYSVYCVSDNCTYYMQTIISVDFGSRFNAAYYPICRSVPDYDFIYESMEIVSEDLGVCELKIAKDAYITSLMEISDNYYISTMSGSTHVLSDEELFEIKEEQRIKELGEFAHTAEDCYENHVYIDDWIDITSFSSPYGKMDPPIFCYVIFNENGLIDTIILNSYA